MASEVSSVTQCHIGSVFLVSVQIHGLGVTHFSVIDQETFFFNYCHYTNLFPLSCFMPSVPEMRLNNFQGSDQASSLLNSI